MWDTPTEDEIDEVFNAIDELLLDDEFSLVDTILKEHRPEEHTTVMNLVLLTVTFPAVLQLQEWVSLYNRIRTHLLTIESADKVNILLLGFPTTREEALKYWGKKE